MNVTNSDLLPNPIYQCRFPAIVKISDLREARNKSKFYIVFERNGYTEDDVVESRLYTYLGKRGDFANFIPDTAPYGDYIDASTSAYITQNALNGITAYPYYTSDYGGHIEYGVDFPDSASLKYTVPTGGHEKYDSGTSAYSESYYNKWRLVKDLTDSPVLKYEPTYSESGHISISRTLDYNRKRRGVFKNPQNPDLNIYKNGGFYKESLGISDVSKTRICLEVDFGDIFYTDFCEYKDRQDGTPGQYSNIDYDPRNGKMQISTKDRNKVLFDVLKGKAPLFFMIVEKLKCSYAGLSNIFVCNNGSSLSAVSTKRQVISDRLRERGDVLWTVNATSTYGNFCRVSVELAQGDEDGKWTPANDDTLRMVWASTDKGYIFGFDYFDGTVKVRRQCGDYPIWAIATNPSNRELIYARVIGHSENNFISVESLCYSDVSLAGENRVIKYVNDYAAKSKFSMLGAESDNSNIAKRIMGGVITKFDGGSDADKKGYWFTFVVNREFTVSVKCSSLTGEDLSGNGAKVSYADRMHFGLFHAKNFIGNYSNSEGSEFWKKMSSYKSGVEYGVKKNSNNIYGITSGPGGRVYVNGHTYLHFDDRQYLSVEGYSPSFAARQWKYDDLSLDGCGQHVIGLNIDTNKDGRKTESYPQCFVRSYKIDFSTGQWAKNRNGKFETVWRSPFAPGCWPIHFEEIRGGLNTNGNRFTSRMMSVCLAGKHQTQQTDGEHRCAMSMNAWKAQSKKSWNATIGENKLGELPTSRSEVDYDSNDVICYCYGAKNAEDGTSGTCNNKTAFALEPDGRIYSSPPDGKDGNVLEAIPRNDEKYTGSGWGAHMSEWKVTLKTDRGGMFYKMLDAGFIYNANSYYGTVYDDNPIPVDKKNKRTEFGNNSEFWYTNGLSEDSNSQCVRLNFVASADSYDFEVVQKSEPGVNLPTGAFNFQRDNDTNSNSAFQSKFDCAHAGTVYYPSKNISNAGNRLGYCEDVDAPGGNVTVPRRSKIGIGSVINSYESATAILSSDFITTHRGMVESISSSGCLTAVSNVGGGNKVSYIYEAFSGSTGVKRIDYGNSTMETKSDTVIGGDNIFDLCLDDTGGIWALDRNGAGLFKKSKASGTNKYWAVPIPGPQITNFGHNRCSHPYIERYVWENGGTVGFNQYLGLKDYSRNAVRDDKKFDIVCMSSDSAQSIVSNLFVSGYNSDPVGMAGVLALGYCWTKSTKAHCMDIAPSGRMVICDHYVIEDSICKDADIRFMGVEEPLSGSYVVASATDKFPSSVDVGGSEVIISADRANISSISALSWDTFTSAFMIGEMSKDEVKFPHLTAFSAKFVGTDQGTSQDDRWVCGDIVVTSALVGRPRNGLPRFPQSFWDYTTEETIKLTNDDEFAAIEAYAKTGMIKSSPIYFADFSTVISHPVSLACAGYDSLYTNHLLSVYDAGSYDVETMEYLFQQNDDYADENKYKAVRVVISQDSLSSITVADSGVTITSGRSNNDINRALDNTDYQSYVDSFCCSACVTDVFGEGWRSINAYGKPIGYFPLKDENNKDVEFGGHPLSGIYGQTVPRQWYGTEVYQYSYKRNEDGTASDVRLNYWHTPDVDEKIGDNLSAFGFHPSVHTDKTNTIDNMKSVSAGVVVENSMRGWYGLPHTVVGMAKTNKFCYVDPHEEPRGYDLDLGTNSVYVYERWPSPYWSTHCENSRGGLKLFGECPDFDDIGNEELDIEPENGEEFDGGENQ